MKPELLRTKQAISQQDEVVAGCDTGFAGLLLRLPPSSTDIRHFQNLMLAEADLIGVIWVGLVAVNSLRFVRIFRRLLDLCCSYRSWCAVHAAQTWLRRSSVCARGSSWVARDR
jgi:hypothetical protein